MSEEHVDPEIAAASALANRLTWLAYAGVVVALIVVATFAVQFHGSPSGDPANWGQFGDYLGGVLNPTFSFLALLALLATLGIQVKELRMSGRELKNSAEALMSQNATLQQQAFEATFFQLLRLHNDIVSGLRIGSPAIAGRTCMAHYCAELRGRLINMEATDSIDQFRIVYDDFYEEYQAVLGHYFRLLYNIFKLVMRTDLPDKRLYTNLVRAQLSSDELLLLFFNCLSHWGSEKFKPMIEYFSLLKTLPLDKLLSQVFLREYDVEAFGGSYPSSHT